MARTAATRARQAAQAANLAAEAAERRAQDLEARAKQLMAQVRGEASPQPATRVPPKKPPVSAKSNTPASARKPKSKTKLRPMTEEEIARNQRFLKLGRGKPPQ